MSGFEHFQEELATLDHEIRHYAAVCGISLETPGELELYLQRPREDSVAGRSAETLQGLLVLRIRLETEMLEAGYVAPSLSV